MIDQVCVGAVSIQDARSIIELLALQAKLEEHTELSERIASLEEAMNVP